MHPALSFITWPCKAVSISVSHGLTYLWIYTHLKVAIVVGDYLYIDGGEITTWNGHDPSSQVTAKRKKHPSCLLTLSVYGILTSYYRH
jgi:hypothetical protein